MLVRSRSAFSNALVGALHQARVPVAGVDRLKLSDPLAVADLLALVRFALQPNDDLTWPACSMSPFLDLDHDQLFTLAAGRRGSLWEAMRDSADARVAAARDWLSQLLGFADFAAPYAFFERVLSGPLGGRQKLLARLGEEARDAIDAVLDQALAFEALQAPSLQGFLAFVDDDSIEIKRDPDAPLAAVRLMTVHGAKGLQAPIVILADATKARRQEREAPLLMSFDNGPELPVFLNSRTGFERPAGGRHRRRRDEDAEREHCRLLYVALTRAEDLLFIGGAGGASNGKVRQGQLVRNRPRGDDQPWRRGHRDGGHGRRGAALRTRHPGGTGGRRGDAGARRIAAPARLAGDAGPAGGTPAAAAVTLCHCRRWCRGTATQPRNARRRPARHGAARAVRAAARNRARAPPRGRGGLCCRGLSRTGCRGAGDDGAGGSG